MRAHIVLQGALLGIVSTLWAQQSTVPTADLKLSAKIKIALVDGESMGGRAVCDGAGNVYVLLGSGKAGTQERAALPLRKIRPDGGVAGTFRVSEAFPNNITGDGVGVIGRSIFVTSGGTVFQAADVHGDTFVVEFAQNGSVKSKRNLAAEGLTHAWIWRLAVSPSGEYLLVASTGEEHFTPFTGVFAPDGKLLKRINEPEDRKASDQATVGDWRPRRVGTVGAVDFVRKSDVSVGPDGNFYLLHGTVSPALVYVISATGDLIRKIPVDAGDSSWIARSIRVYAGRIAVQFDKWLDSDNQRNLIQVTDLEGLPLTDYRVGPMADGNGSLYLAGFGSDGFTFTPYYAEKEMYLVKAKLP